MTAPTAYRVPTSGAAASALWLANARMAVRFTPTSTGKGIITMSEARTVLCFFNCGFVVIDDDPISAHARMEAHYQSAHADALDRLVPAWSTEDADE